MASFILYDLIFLVLFTLIVVLFLYKRRHNLHRQGILYLYKTKVGIKFIEWTSRKFPRTLYYLQYIVVFSGFILMISITYLIIKFSIFYISSPFAAKALKVPVLLPLVPYIPEIFNLDFLPPFYFTYWIVILAIVAIPHEFAHGIFARLNKIKILSTGFGFLGPFLAAFVEPDENTMNKRNKFPQMAILASGTFANIVFTVIFALIFWLFFVLSFHPAGLIFNSYASVNMPVSAVSSINGIPVSDKAEILSLINESSEFTEIKIKNSNTNNESNLESENKLSFFVITNNLKIALENDLDRFPAIIDSPAFRAKLSGAISEVDGIPLTSFEELGAILKSHKPGDVVSITTIGDKGERKDNKIELSEFNGKAFLGIGIASPNREGLLGAVYGFIADVKDPFVYYESSLGNFGLFIYHMLWWAILISISVALVNMLPLGIFDGGRFFMLTIWGITGSKKFAETAFKFSTYLFLILIAAMMIKWLFIFV